MAYYFECKECGKKEFFNYVMQSEYYGLKTPEGKKQDYETVICKALHAAFSPASSESKQNTTFFFNLKSVCR